MKFEEGSANFILIYWPGYVGELHFSKAIKQTADSAPNFTRAMHYLLTHSKVPDPYITFIAHSLGNRECVQTILNLKSQHGMAPVKKFIQLAPAIFANSYTADFQEAAALVNDITIYYSQNDPILKYDYSFWDIVHFDMSVLVNNVQNMFRRDKIINPYYAMGYLGPYGPMPPVARKIDANSIAATPVNHGTYLTDQKLIEDAAKRVNS